jgi:hypothetical protein
MACLPGMPCYENTTVTVYTTYPSGCTSSPCLSYPIGSDYTSYTGPNLPNTGILNNDLLTAAFQKIDNKLDPTDLVTKMIAELTVNPTLRALFCNLVNDC